MVLEVISRAFTLSQVDISTTAPVTQALTGIQNVRIDKGNQHSVVGGDGSAYSTFVSLMRQVNALTFDTTMIATALGIAGMSGLKIDAATTPFGFNTYWQAYADGAIRGGNGTNIKNNIKKGLLIPTSISVSHGGNAVLSYALAIIWDGTNNPVITTLSQNLPAVAQVTELFTLGPVNINGTNLEGIQSIQINFGMSPLRVGGDGAIWDSFAAIEAVEPSAIITTTDMNVENTLSLIGTVQGATASQFFLRKKTAGAASVANATEEHIEFTMEKGTLIVNDESAAHRANGLSTVLFQPTWDGSNDPFAIDITAAIA